MVTLKTVCHVSDVELVSQKVEAISLIFFIIYCFAVFVFRLFYLFILFLYSYFVVGFLNTIRNVALNLSTLLYR